MVMGHCENFQESTADTLHPAKLKLEASRHLSHAVCCLVLYICQQRTAGTSSAVHNLLRDSRTLMISLD